MLITAEFSLTVPYPCLTFCRIKRQTYKHLSGVFAVNELDVLTCIDEHVPVLAGRWPVAMHEDHVQLGHVQHAENTEEEQRVHLAASDPDHVPDVRRQVYVRRQWYDDIRSTVEGLPQMPANVAVQGPDIARVQWLQHVETQSHGGVDISQPRVGRTLDHPDF